MKPEEVKRMGIEVAQKLRHAYACGTAGADNENYMTSVTLSVLREAAEAIAGLIEGQEAFAAAGLAMPDGSPLPLEAFAVTHSPSGWPSNGPERFVARPVRRHMNWVDGVGRKPIMFGVHREEADAVRLRDQMNKDAHDRWLDGESPASAQDTRTQDTVPSPSPAGGEHA